VTAVIDASALVAYCLREKDLDAEMVRENLRTGVLSVGLVKAEAANAILMARRRGIVDDDEARASLASMLELCNNNINLLSESDEMIHEAFEISQSNNVAIYDSLYISIAKKTKSTLLSKDERQKDVARKLRIGVEPV
jgi:predicted nucleic acid-binding protein